MVSANTVQSRLPRIPLHIAKNIAMKPREAENHKQRLMPAKEALSNAGKNKVYASGVHRQ